MKSFTSLEQSKKLAEILPIESADMVYIASANDDIGDTLYTAEYKSEIIINEGDTDYINCWSLAALLDVINNNYYTTLYHDGVAWNIKIIHHDNVKDKHGVYAGTPIDACYEMIIKLKELKML